MPRWLVPYVEAFDLFDLRRLRARMDQPDADPGEVELVDRVAEVYWHRIRQTGIGPAQLKAGRDELRAGVATVVAHLREHDPEEIATIETLLDRYDASRRAAGIDRALLEQPSRLLPGPLGHVQSAVEVALGAVPALVGTLTGGLPYLLARRRLHGLGHVPSLSEVVRIAAAYLVPAYVGWVALVAWQFSTAATVTAALVLAGTWSFAIAYRRRVRTIVAHVGNRTVGWLQLEATAAARRDLDAVVAELDRLRNRFRTEVENWGPLPADARRRSLRVATARVVGVVGTAVLAAVFLISALDRPIPDLPLGPSPWLETRLTDPISAERELRRDASGVLLAARQLDRMEQQMDQLYREFQGPERDLLTQADHDAMRALMVAFHDLRVALLKTIWLYRGDNGEPLAPTDPLEAQAFLTAYAATSLLVEKAWLIYQTFRSDPESQAQLDAADAAWGLPPGTYSDIVDGLTNRSVMAEVRAASAAFDRRLAAGSFPSEEPWASLTARAAEARPSVQEALDDIGPRRLDRTLREMAIQLRSPVDELTPVVSLAVSRFRFKERPAHRGLISPEQVEDLRERLRPGDILVERRNWYISNSLLPGFWPHAALYLGSRAELEALGVGQDALAASHLAELDGVNDLGDRYAVIEAIGEGVIYTSLEQSVGEADAVAVLRPILSDAELRDALIRALSHRGKEYDFDFDFRTTDRLVCTELIFRTYDGILDLPEMRMIVGQPRLAAVDYVRMWAEGVESGAPQLELVEFLDFDEANQRAVPADAATLVETLDRSRFTFVR